MQAGQGCPYSSRCAGFLGPYAGVWLWDRLVVRARYLEVDVEPRFGVSDRETDRTLFLAEFLYHLRRGEAFRPYVGLALGRREDLVGPCEPPFCAEPEALPGGPSLAARRVAGGTGGPVFGALVPLGRWVSLRGQVAFADLGLDNPATTVYSIEAGVRFWGRH